MKIASEIDRREFFQSTALLTSAALLPQRAPGSPPAQPRLSLSTWPHRVYKEDDGILGPANTESCVFNLLVKGDGLVDPVSARLEFLAAGERIHVLELSRQALEAIRGVSIANRGPDREEEMFDLRHCFSLPARLDVSRLVYALDLVQPGGRRVHQALEIALLRYEQKTKLIFPMKGKVMVGLGHDFNEPHSDGRSQHHAIDILGLGPHGEITRNGGGANSDLFTWGREVLAPADGSVVYARDDVPDNTVPGRVDREAYAKLPKPDWANPGNNVLLDHGNGEYSSLGHMQRGTVRVKTGDRVRQGEVVGLGGSSGESQVTHLHYQLTSGADLFLADGLPARFENLSWDLLGTPTRIAAPKRGIVLEAH